MFPILPLSALARLAQLRRLLEEDPQNPLAWYWELQVRVLAALTSLYGDYSTRLPWNPFRPLTLRLTRHRPPGTKSREEIRLLLHKISDANQERKQRGK